MEFFCCHRDRPSALAIREELDWSYMDRYTKELIARGPTFADDGETPTGSLHIVDLPDPAAARAFAFDEPNYQADAYRDVLGRTMWDFPGGRPGGKPVPGARPRRGPGHRPCPAARGGRTGRVRAAAVRRRPHLAGYDGAAQGPGSGDGASCLDCGPVCGHRGPRLGVRRASTSYGGAGLMSSPAHIDLGQEW